MSNISQCINITHFHYILTPQSAAYLNLAYFADLKFLMLPFRCVVFSAVCFSSDVGRVGVNFKWGSAWFESSIFCHRTEREPSVFASPVTIWVSFAFWVGIRCLVWCSRFSVRLFLRTPFD